MKDDNILSRIKNLEQSLQWREESLEQARLALVERASECTAEQIAHGWLESDINQIGREVEEVKSLRDQIKLLEYLLKNAE